MISRRPSRKPDLFATMVFAVTLGVSVTVAYQISVYQDKYDLALARQTKSLLSAPRG